MTVNERRNRRSHVSHDRWLVSYADFVTLLFAFFVVMYASSQVDQKKVVQLSSAIESAFQELGIFQVDAHKPAKPSSKTHLAESHPAGPPLSLIRASAPVLGPQELNHQHEDYAAIRAQLEKALANELKRNEVALHTEPDGLVISLREIGFFDSGSASIKPQAEDALTRVANILQVYWCAIRIEGHTDTVPIHTAHFASNWELSTARATELVKLLIEQHDFAPERLSAAGYAEFHPVADNDTSYGRQMNRRVDIVILSAAVRPAFISTNGSFSPELPLARQHTASPLDRVLPVPFENLKPSHDEIVTSPAALR